MRIVDRTGTTGLMVTHGVDDAALRSDRLVTMTNGPAARTRSFPSAYRNRASASCPPDSRFVALRASVLRFLYERQAPSQTPTTASRCCSGA
jgi:nitrate/nitrite transport system ATP-binding protein